MCKNLAMRSSANLDNKRVCHLTTVHPYNDNRIFHKQCVSLAKNGYEVFLLATVSHRFVERDVTVIPLGVAKSRWHRFFVKMPILIFKAMQLRAAVYHFHDPELLLAVPFLKLTGASVVYDIHEDYVTSIAQKPYVPKFLRNLLTGPFAIMEKAIGGRCKQVIAEKYYKKRFPKAVQILNYPLVSQIKSDRIFSETKLESFDPVYSWFLYTGNVSISRGALDQLQVLSTRSDTAIAYIGYCPKPIAQQIYKFVDDNGIDRERIILIGVGKYVPRDLIHSYTNLSHWKAGLALFPKTPHYEEKELTKFFEYMQASIPVLCTDFDVWKKLIETSNTGKAVSIESDGNLVAALEFFMQESNSLSEIRKAGPIAVTTHYNWGMEELKLLSLYATLV